MSFSETIWHILAKKETSAFMFLQAFTFRNIYKCYTKFWIQLFYDYNTRRVIRNSTYKTLYVDTWASLCVVIIFLRKSFFH